LELADEVGKPVLITQALAAINDAHGGPAHTMLRRDNADAIVELALAAGDRMMELLGYRFRIVADLEVGDLGAVDRSIAAFSALADQLRQPLVSWYVPLFRGMRALLGGDLGAAERHHGEVAAAANATGSHNAEMLAVTPVARDPGSPTGAARSPTRWMGSSTSIRPTGPATPPVWRWSAGRPATPTGPRSC